MIYLIPNILAVSFLLVLSVGCKKNKSEHMEKLKPLKSYSLKISEPSDLALNKGKLWIVSDRKSTVYQTDLKGEVEFSFKIKETDLEGITIIDNSIIAIALEISREILLTDLTGSEISRSSLKVNGGQNSGLEGITYNSSNEHFYILNEKDPVLLIETDKKLNELSRKEIKNIRDLSGISYSVKENCLWLVSDEDKKIIKSTLEGEFISEYKINVEQPEGIAVDDENNLIYVVSDKEEKLFIYKIE